MAGEWWHRRMCSFDLETTSVDPEEARIVSAAVAFVGGGEPTEEWATMVDPGVEIPQEAAEIHGISTELAREEGAPADWAIPAIYEELSRAKPGMALVVFNAPYDLTVLDREFRRQQLRGGLPGVRVVDPLMLDRHVERYRKGSRKLIDTCRHYGAMLEGPHDACFDAVAAARLAWVIAGRGRIVRRAHDEQEWRELRELEAEWERVRGDLDELHKAQRRWYREMAESLERYFHTGNAAKGVPPQPERVVPRDWPLIPFMPVQEVLDVWR